MKVMDVILVRQVILEMQETQIMQIMQEILTSVSRLPSLFLFEQNMHEKNSEQILSVRLRPKFDSLPSFYQVHILRTAASSLLSLSKSL